MAAMYDVINLDLTEGFWGYPAELRCVFRDALRLRCIWDDEDLGIETDKGQESGRVIEIQV
jgi:hypothetical protein